MKLEISENDFIYPGKFVPANSKEPIYKKPGHPAKHCRKFRDFVVKELSGLYEVHLSAPGMKREKFIVYGNDQSLLINTPANRQIKCAQMNCTIPMPENADTELAIAEYKNGVLHLYIPKTSQHSKHMNTRIIVY